MLDGSYLICGDGRDKRQDKGQEDGVRGWIVQQGFNGFPLFALATMGKQLIRVETMHNRQQQFRYWSKSNFRDSCAPRISSTMPDQKLNSVRYTGFPESLRKGQSLWSLAHYIASLSLTTPGCNTTFTHPSADTSLPRVRPCAVLRTRALIRVSLT